MRDPLLRYFAGEKQAGLLCLALGGMAVLFSAWVWRIYPDFRAMAIQLLVVAVIQVGVGTVLVSRTAAQMATLQRVLTLNPTDARARELTRMNRFNASFRV